MVNCLKRNLYLCEINMETGYDTRYWRASPTKRYSADNSPVKRAKYMIVVPERRILPMRLSRIAFTITDTNVELLETPGSKL